MSHWDGSGPARPSIRRAFTLVELLVVIGIIALLVSILLPSLRKARLQALRVACASNMHQTLLSLQMYANQFKEYPVNGLPDEPILRQTYNSYNNLYTASGSSGQPSHWRGYLVAYKFGSPKALGCASRMDNENLVWHYAGATTNWYEDYNSLKQAPPYVYWGPGTDCLRVWGYTVGIPDFLYYGDDANVRASRNFITKGRHPIVTDAFGKVNTGTTYGLDGSLVTPHSYRYAGGWYGGWNNDENRFYDHNVGFTDGSVITCVRTFRVGEAHLLFDYNWAQPQKHWGR